MQYVNFVHGGRGEEVMHTAPVAADDAAYLRRVIAELRPLSEDKYTNGPAAILNTLARYSYVLDGRELYWCVGWDPGLIVVRFSPDGGMAWVAVRSPVPDFGGRLAEDADWDDYDEDAPNPQYSLVFTPWDAQFDSQKRKWKSFAPAGSDVQVRFRAALSRADELSEALKRRYSDDQDARDAWLEQCEKNLKVWCGDGVRLR